MMTTTSRVAPRHQATLEGRSTATEIAVASRRRPTCRCSNRRPSRSAARRSVVDELGIVGLAQQHDAPVVGEVDVAQLRMAIEAEALPDERLEVAGQEVGEEERPRLVVVECRRRARRRRTARSSARRGGARRRDGRRAIGRARHRSRSRRRRRRPFDRWPRPRRGSVREQGRCARGGCGSAPAGSGLRRCRAGGRHAARRRGRRRRRSGPVHATEGPGGSARRRRRAWTSSLAVSAATAASRQYASAPTAVPNSSFNGAPPTSTM